MNDMNLRTKLIRLAHANPAVRKEVLPLLTKQAIEGWPAYGEGPKAQEKFVQAFAKELLEGEGSLEFAECLSVPDDNHFWSYTVKGNTISFKVRHPLSGTALMPKSTGEVSTFVIYFDKDGMPTLEGFIHGKRVKHSFAHLRQSVSKVALAIYNFVAKFTRDLLAAEKKNRQAHANPAVRKDVLPLLTKQAGAVSYKDLLLQAQKEFQEQVIKAGDAYHRAVLTLLTDRLNALSSRTGPVNQRGALAPRTMWSLEVNNDTEVSVILHNKWSGTPTSRFYELEVTDDTKGKTLTPGNTRFPSWETLVSDRMANSIFVQISAALEKAGIL